MHRSELRPPTRRRPHRLILGVAAAAMLAAPSAAEADARLKIVKPGAEQLVDGDRMELVIRAPRAATTPRVTLDKGRVKPAFRRKGNLWIGVVRGARPGREHIDVQTRAGGKDLSARVTVRGATARLLTPRPTRGDVFRHALGEGVWKLAFGVAPRATVRVQLNQRQVRLPRLHLDRVQRLVLGRADGLRHGRNDLRVVAALPDGRHQVLRRSLTVRSDIPLASAGRDVRTRAARAIGLDARGSRAARSESALRYRWSLVESSAKGGAALTGAGSAQPRLKVRKPGHYTVAVTATEPGPTARPRSRLTSFRSRPATRGRRSATAFRPSPRATATSGCAMTASGRRGRAAFGDSPAGVYLFDDATLDRKTYPISAANADPDLASALKQFNRHAIVIVVGKAGWRSSSKKLPTSGPFTYVFSYAGGDVPDLASSTGTVNAGKDLGDGQGAVSGYLQYDVSQKTHRSSAAPISRSARTLPPTRPSARVTVRRTACAPRPTAR